MRILVTGGVRSGKSTHAEDLIGGAPATYVATGTPPDREQDPDWAARIDAHRDRRPDAWGTLETQDLAGVIASAGDPLLVDCLGTWLTAIIDADDAWEHDSDAVHDLVLARTDEVVEALNRCEQDVVLVTNEVGMSVHPPTPLGRMFVEVAGWTHQRVARAADEIYLAVLGTTLKIKPPPA